jgi:hypothetical protein
MTRYLHSTATPSEETSSKKKMSALAASGDRANDDFRTSPDNVQSFTEFFKVTGPAAVSLL